MSKKDCKIIEDLLPNYIDGLTNDETNRYIKEHLSICEKCNEIFKDMTKDIEIDKIDTNEIDYLKKVKRNFKIGFVLMLLNILIVIIFVNNILLREIKVILFSGERNSMIITQTQYKIDGNINETIKNYYIFNENDRCTSTFVEITSNDEKYLKEEYLYLKYLKEDMVQEKEEPLIFFKIKKRTNELLYSNLKYENGKITYSTNLNNNLKKDRIKAFNNPKTFIEEY